MSVLSEIEAFSWGGVRFRAFVFGTVDSCASQRQRQVGIGALPCLPPWKEEDSLTCSNTPRRTLKSNTDTKPNEFHYAQLPPYAIRVPQVPDFEQVEKVFLD
jgi:hypothetical protein